MTLEFIKPSKNERKIPVEANEFRIRKTLFIKLLPITISVDEGTRKVSPDKNGITKITADVALFEEEGLELSNAIAWIIPILKLARATKPTIM